MRYAPPPTDCLIYNPAILIQIKVTGSNRGKQSDPDAERRPALDLLSLVIGGVLIVMLLLLIFRLPLAIVSNLRAGHRFRKSMAMALDELRLSRMLSHLGIDRDKYLHEESALAIKQHMQRCDACDAKDSCDQALEQHKDRERPADAEQLGFCANIDDLKQIRDRR